MRNPWQDVPVEPPYLLPADRPYVESFNRHVTLAYRLDVRLLPEPFLGSRGAPLVVLNLNPGIAGSEYRVHNWPAYSRALRANLGADRRGHHQVNLDPAFAKTPGGRWSRKCFKAVIAAGVNHADLARRVLLVEFHGYHARSWRPIPVTLPSQRYGFWLVEQAMNRGATIIPMRGVRDWEVAVPHLGSYKRRVGIRNPRSATISPANCGQRGFDLVIEAVTGRSK